MHRILKRRTPRILHKAAIAATAMLVLAATGAKAESNSEKEQRKAREWLVGCKNSPLTQDTFLDLIYNIAMHGDLTDEAFTEKTL